MTTAKTALIVDDSRVSRRLTRLRIATRRAGLVEKPVTVACIAQLPAALEAA